MFLLTFLDVGLTLDQELTSSEHVARASLWVCWVCFISCARFTL